MFSCLYKKISNVTNVTIMDNGHSSNAQLWIKWSIVSEVRNISDLAVIYSEVLLTYVKKKNELFSRFDVVNRFTQENSSVSIWLSKILSDLIYHDGIASTFYRHHFYLVNSNFLDQNMLLSMKPNLDYRTGYYLLGPHQPLCESSIIQKDWYKTRKFQGSSTVLYCRMASFHSRNSMMWCHFSSVRWISY